MNLATQTKKLPSFSRRGGRRPGWFGLWLEPRSAAQTLAAKALPTAAFTLIELMVALVITMTAMTIVLTTFTTTLNAWQRGTAALEDLHHGDFVMEQLVSALRSAIIFGSTPGAYSFRVESRSGGSYPNDLASWVTSGTAFMPQDSPLNRGLHRIVVTVENNPDGDPAFAIRALPHLSEDEDEDPDPWFVSTEVKGLKFRFYNVEDEDWDDEWEDTNSLPAIVEVTLYLDPLEKYGPPVEFKRLVRIPLGGAVPEAVKATGPESSAPVKTDQKPTDGGGGQPAEGQPAKEGGTRIEVKQGG